MGGSMMLRTALGAIDTAGRWAGAIAAVLVFGIMALIIAEVFARSILGISLSFAWEFAAYFMGTAIFLGAAFTMHTGGHVRVALFRGLLNARGNHVMDLVATIIGTAAVSFLAWSLVQFAWRSFERGSVSPDRKSVV